MPAPSAQPLAGDLPLTGRSAAPTWICHCQLCKRPPTAEERMVPVGLVGPREQLAIGRGRPRPSAGRDLRGALQLDLPVVVPQPGDTYPGRRRLVPAGQPPPDLADL